MKGTTQYSNNNNVKGTLIGGSKSAGGLQRHERETRKFNLQYEVYLGIVYSKRGGNSVQEAK